MYDNLKHLGRFASLNPDIDIVTDPTLVDAAHAGKPLMFTQRIMTSLKMHKNLRATHIVNAYFKLTCSIVYRIYRIEPFLPVGGLTSVTLLTAPS